MTIHKSSAVLLLTLAVACQGGGDKAEDALHHTSTPESPWYVIPADHKWFARLSVADIICARLSELPLSYPTVTEEQKQGLLKVKESLDNEPS